MQTPRLQPIIPVTGWNRGTSRRSDSEAVRFSRGLRRKSAVGEGACGEQTEEQEAWLLAKLVKGGGLTDREREEPWGNSTGNVKNIYKLHGGNIITFLDKETYCRQEA